MPLATATATRPALGSVMGPGGRRTPTPAPAARPALPPRRGEARHLGGSPIGRCGGFAPAPPRRAPAPPSSTPIAVTGGGDGGGRVPPRTGGKVTAEADGNDWDDASQDGVSATATKIVARVRGVCREARGQGA